MSLVLVTQLAFLFGVPALLVWAEPRVRLIAAISPVVLCYGAGIVAANLPGVVFAEPLATTLIAATVLVAVPMLLFPSDLRQWLRLARPTVTSFALATLAVCLTASLAAVSVGPRLPGSADISGMLVGVYTGGTPNMSAIAIARGVEHDTFILVNAADLMLGSVYLLFLMTLAKPILARFYPAFSSVGDAGPAPGRMEPAPTLARRSGGAAIALLLSASLGATAAGLSWLLLGRLSEPLIILAITSLAIACSLWRRVRELPGSYEVGQYLLLVFCITIGTQANIANLVAASSFIMVYCALVLFGAIALHFLAARLLRIDIDTLLITSTAAVYGPPFVGPMAKVLGNREIVVSGMTAGVLGLAIGNYLGYAIAAALS